jgi:RIO kinase 1
VRVPRPIAVEKNVLVMEFIGDKGIPAPRLKDSPHKNLSTTLRTILRYVKMLYSKGQIVHADLSEYNILMRKGPVIIDISQAVHIDHPLSKEYLKRDLENIVRYFSSLGITSESVPSLYESITKEQYSRESETKIHLRGK